MIPQAATDWGRAHLALDLLAAGIGTGLILRGPWCPSLERVVGRATALLPGVRRIPASALEARLHTNAHALLPSEPAKSPLNAPTLLITGAERLTSLSAALLAQAIDGGEAPLLILVDESETDGPGTAPALEARLSYDVALAPQSSQIAAPPLAAITFAAPGAGDLRDAITWAAQLGVEEPRHALAFAAAAAALKDAEAAAALTLLPRATQVPEAPPQADQHPDTSDDPAEGEGEQGIDLPQELLTGIASGDFGLSLQLGQGRRTYMAGQGAGARKLSNRRGRPLPASRRPAKGGDAAIHVAETIKAAIPFQRLRPPPTDGLLLRLYPSDLRYRRYENRSDRLVIFVVDGSGSAAFARLAEAKGAIEGVLGQAYAERDHIALVQFRDQGAEVLVDPTRSLTAARRGLAETPAGGATPLAAGLTAALRLATQARTKGMSPFIVLSTDGRANVALDGSTDRTTAGRDADRAARLLAAHAVPGLFVDLARRPGAALRTLAARAEADYVALPRSQPDAVGKHVSAALAQR
ncbi:MAG: VWA domain-containing protein [Shimia sp.]